MFLKSSVKVDGVKPEILLALLVAYDVWANFGHTLTVTSCNDSTHKQGSFHYKGWAVDLRTKDLPTLARKKEIIAALEERLTKDYDVVFEDEGGSNEHIHLEYDLK